MAHAPALFDRRVVLEGSFNFRDLGGYRTRDAQWIVPARLYRADGPDALTETDGTALRRLGLRTVIDLRSAGELAAQPSYISALSDVIGHHLPLLDVTPSEDELTGWIDPVAVAARYREMLEIGRANVAEALEILCDPASYPVLIHCTAGKDRTGVMAALTLGLLDVPDDMIIADYSASGTAMRAYVDYLERAHPEAREVIDRFAPVILAAHPATMAVLIEGLRHDYGSFDGFARELGLPSAPDDLRTALLA